MTTRAHCAQVYNLTFCELEFVRGYYAAVGNSDIQVRVHQPSRERKWAWWAHTRCGKTVHSDRSCGERRVELHRWHPSRPLTLSSPGGVLRSSCPSAYSRFVSSPTHLSCHLGSQRQASWPLQAAVQQQQAESSQTLRMLAALQQSTAEELSALHDAAVDGDVEGVSGLQRAVAELHHATDEERRQRTAQQQVRAT